MIKKQVKFLAIAIGLMLGLPGCAGLLDQEGFLAEADFFSSSAPNADLALGALAKADYAGAEKYVDAAMKQNNRNPYTLLAAGILYQNTGRPAKARQAYEELMSLRPAAYVNMQGWTRMNPVPMMDIAMANMQALELGQTANPWPGVPNMGVPNMGVPNMGAPMQPVPMVAPAPGGTMPSDYAGGAPLAVQSMNMSPGNLGPGSAAMGDAGDENTIQRFEILGRLLKEGLITNEEYNLRRQANLGGLLPLSAPSPASGLDRPVPSAEQVVGRIKALRRSFELRAISARQHASERQMILDGLLPATFVSKAPPTAPPQGLMQAAAAVSRLENLRAANLINSDEFARERTAIERGMQGDGAVASTGSSTDSNGQMLIPPGNGSARTSGVTGGASYGGTSSGGTGGAGVHLASYKSRALAEKGWGLLQRKLGGLLDGLGPVIREVNLGSRGIYYRLIGGSMDSKSAADALCAQIKATGQYCTGVNL